MTLNRIKNHGQLPSYKGRRGRSASLGGTTPDWLTHYTPISRLIDDDILAGTQKSHAGSCRSPKNHHSGLIVSQSTEPFLLSLLYRLRPSKRVSTTSNLTLNQSKISLHYPRKNPSHLIYNQNKP
jgi:hypothetical protein